MSSPEPSAARLRRLSRIEIQSRYPIGTCACTIAVLSYFSVAAVTHSTIDDWVALLFSLPAAILVLKETLSVVQMLKVARSDTYLCASVQTMLDSAAVEQRPQQAKKFGVDFAFVRDSMLYLVVCVGEPDMRAAYDKRLRDAVKTSRKTSPTTGVLLVKNTEASTSPVTINDISDALRCAKNYSSAI